MLVLFSIIESNSTPIDDIKGAEIFIQNGADVNSKDSRVSDDFYVNISSLLNDCAFEQCVSLVWYFPKTILSYIVTKQKC